MKSIDEYRSFLKDDLRKEIDFSQTDQRRGVEPPPTQKPYNPDASIIELPHRGEWTSINDPGLIAAMAARKSVRRYKSEPLNLEELAFLLWATQGIKQRLNQATAKRTVPSAGCRHSFETYLRVADVESLDTGVYRYLPLEHALLFEHAVENSTARLDRATFGQRFIAAAPVAFIWTTIPYRMEWRYDRAAHRVILMDAGHVCQNLYLACQAIGAGTCAVAAFDQDRMDEFVGVDGEDEFVVYLAPVGRV